MPKPYHVLSDYFPHPSWQAQMGTAITGVGGDDGLRGLTGQKIMTAKPMNFQQLFDAYVRYIRTPGNGHLERFGPRGFRRCDAR